jgi:hypothetical protein
MAPSCSFFQKGRSVIQEEETAEYFIILNPEEETHAMHAKEGIYERCSTHPWGGTFSI